MKVKIRLDTKPDAYKFCAIVSQLDGKIYIVDASEGLKVNAKSVLGALYSMEFHDLWCISEKDIYHAIEEFIIIE